MSSERVAARNFLWLFVPQELDLWPSSARLSGRFTYGFWVNYNGLTASSMVRGNYPKIALFQVSIILIYPDMSWKEKTCLWDTGHFFSQRTLQFSHNCFVVLEFHVLNPWTSTSNKGASSQMGKAMLHPSSLQWPIRDPNILSFIVMSLWKSPLMGWPRWSPFLDIQIISSWPGKK